MRSAGPGWTRRAAAPRSRWRRLWDWLLTLAILGLLVLLAARLDRTETRNLDGRVTVNDGDSLTLGTERIRLRGIDAPEFGQTCRKDGADYPCGRRARETLVALIAGRPVSCSGWERDKYDRLLATCIVGGADLNRRLVETGWALGYGDYEAEESAARGKGAGLWAGSFERPRDWRETHGGMAESEHAAGFLDWLRRTFRFM
jgi:endonuclease YncB( thermonuclease family)